MLTTEHLKILNLARYVFQLRASVDAVFPPFLGTSLRGAFGHALKAIACSVPHGNCSRCLLVERCLYPRLFETAALNPPAPLKHKSRMSSSVSDATGKQQPQPPTLLKNRQDAPRPFIFIPPLPASDNGFMRARDDLLRWRVRVRAGERVTFGLSLFGDAIEELPYVIYAINLMARHGFGAERASFTLERVVSIDAADNRTVIYTPDMTSIKTVLAHETTLGSLVHARLMQLLAERTAVVNASNGRTAAAGAANQHSTIGNTKRPSTPHSALSAQQSALSTRHSALGIRNSALITEKPISSRQSAIGNELTLRFITPTRLRIKGRVVEHPSFTQLVSSISLRLSMLAETWGGAPLVYDYKAMIERARDVSTLESSLRLMALDRFSNRRHGKLDLDGFMGEITFAVPVLQEFLPLLVAGEFLHVGSGTAFGLGRYYIV